ncbi:MAG: hypothetical protein ACM32O_16395 [Clostridia bacterium]
MSANVELSILFGLCITFGMVLFNRAIPAENKQAGGGPLAALFVMLITVGVLLVGCIPLILALTAILWLSGLLFPNLIDHSHLWMLFFFSIGTVILMIFYELLAEPFLKAFLQQIGLSIEWTVLAQLVVTTFVMLLLSATIIKGVILSPSVTLFIAGASVTFDYFLERALPSKKKG